MGAPVLMYRIEGPGPSLDIVSRTSPLPFHSIMDLRGGKAVPPYLLDLVPVLPRPLNEDSE